MSMMSKESLELDNDEVDNVVTDVEMIEQKYENLIKFFYESY